MIKKKEKQTKYRLKTILHTCGNGFWSDEMRKVQVTKAVIKYYIEDNVIQNGLELKVFFSKKSWDPDKHGLIYTDKLFIKELKVWLKSLGLSGYVDYTEQGMQGDNYVSLEVDKRFFNSWNKLGFATEKIIWSSDK